MQLTGLRPPIAAAASSDLRRARQTAQIFARVLGLSPPVRVPGLRERDAGQWTGRTSLEIEALSPGELDRWRRGEVVDPPGGEPWNGFTDRVLAALGDLAATAIGDPVVVVAHQGVLRALEHHFGLGPDPAAGHGGLWLRARGQAVALLARR